MASPPVPPNEQSHPRTNGISTKSACLFVKLHACWSRISVQPHPNHCSQYICHVLWPDQHTASVGIVVLISLEKEQLEFHSVHYLVVMSSCCTRTMPWSCSMHSFPPVFASSGSLKIKETGETGETGRSGWKRRPLFSLY